MSDQSETTSSAAGADAPVLVLGTHRSGTSAVTGLLATAGGLELGDVLPPTKANAKGYFESVAAVRSHNQLLDALDRDWTCPPPDLDPTAVPIDGIRAEVDHLASLGRPWGVKDPRLLFMLPVWAHLLPEVRMIAVVRDHEEVVRSLVARDGLDGGVADIITSAHVRRLRILVERFDIPVVDFSAGTDVVLERTREIARAIGLSWDEETANHFFDASLARSRARGLANRNADLEVIREVGTERTTVGTVAAEDLRKVLDDEFADLPDEFDRHVGPRSAARRRRVWARVPADARPALEVVSTLSVAASMQPVPSGAEAVAGADLHTLDRELRAARPLGAVVLADVTSWLRRDELRGLLRLVREHVQDGGVLRLGLSSADADVTRRRGRDPITVEDVRAAVDDTDWVVAAEEETANLQVLELRALRSTASVLQALVDTGLTTTMDEAALAAAAAAAPAPAPSPSPATTDATRALERQLEQARADVAAWRYRYERLRGRRSVRAVLRIASLARPLFRAVRRVRNG